MEGQGKKEKDDIICSLFDSLAKMLMMQQMISKGQIPAGLTPQQQAST